MAMESKLSRTLEGHSRSLLCCHASLSHPDLLATSSQDGTVCIFDLRDKNTVQRHECFGHEDVSSVCFTSVRCDVLYAAAGASVYCIDTRLGSSGGAAVKYTFNSEEINQIALNQKASYLAAADDNGEIKVIDLRNHELLKTLRGVHTNICSTVQFHPHRHWELLSGGLDSRIVKWDFSKGRPLKIVDQGTDAAPPGISGQFCNPPFVHAIAIPEGKLSGEAGKVMAVARGNGAVEICDLALEKCQELHPQGTITKYLNKDKLSRRESLQQLETSDRGDDTIEGRHLTAASSVTFARFATSSSLIVSGSNDRHIKLWDWGKESGAASMASSSASTRTGPLLLNINHKKKVNWICTAARSSENVFVVDTTKRLSIYTFS